MLANASAAFAKGDYDSVISLSQEAQRTAELASYPQITSTTISIADSATATSPEETSLLTMMIKAWLTTTIGNVLLAAVAITIVIAATIVIAQAYGFTIRKISS